MDTRDIVLYVFDLRANFEKSKKYFGAEGSAFKKIICVEDEIEFESQFKILNDDEFVFMVVHAFFTDNISGLKRFAASLIEKRYPDLGFMYISEGDSKEIQKQMIDADIRNSPVYKYHQVQSSLEENKFKSYSKKEIILLSSKSQVDQHSTSSSVNKRNEIYPQCDYGIITALEEDEMEKVLPMITSIGRTKSKKHLIEYGHLKSNPNKKIAYASQLSTGMIDAAILASEMVHIFRPKFLIMAGVLGGKPNYVNIGDVVVATKVFTIDKGKIGDYGFKQEIESSNVDNAYVTVLKRNKADIIDYIKKSDQTRKNPINIHFGAIVCVRQVIDLEGFFDANVSSVDRKAIALEMESYGIARACELVNEGETTPIIIKAAMDNTIDKLDDAKTYAAWTSAKFVEFILENGLI